MSLIPSLGRSHTLRSNYALAPQLLKPICPGPMICSNRSHCNEKPTHPKEEELLLATARERLHPATKTQLDQKTRYIEV